MADKKTQVVESPFHATDLMKSPLVKPDMTPDEVGAALAFATYHMEGMLPQMAPDSMMQAQPTQPQQNEDPVKTQIEELRSEGLTKAKVKQAMSKLVDNVFNEQQS